MKSSNMGRTRSRAAIVVAAAASVAAGAALLPVTSASAATARSAAPTVSQQTRATFQRLADAVLTDRTDALVDGTQGDRKKPLTAGFSGDVRLSAALARSENAALSSLDLRKDRLAALGEKYSKANTTVTLNSTRVRGAKAEVAVTETTTLTYQKVRGDEPGTTGFQAHHALTFTADARGHWQLTGIRNTDAAADVAVNQPAKPSVTTRVGTVADDTMPNAPRAATTRTAPAKAKTLTGGTFDYKAMATYAEKYWSTYNPAYPNFNGHAAGGDCTNFVSQSLKAGGWKHVPGYVYDYTRWFGNAEIQSDSFVGVNEWSWFAQNSKRTTSLAYVYQMDVGDVLQMDFEKDGSKDHTMIVTYRSAQGVPYLTYHSANTYRRSLASIIASEPNSYYYAYRT
ncbi:amidase domain-containing protein [Streptomyces sp. NBC_00576]|uniref:amidase domain-containing protein n=1 Tax=Streptomyces sp. NBC_00576 TaxID=2903665 RepID=UPI002E7FEA7C|nr:amidase domain-containing protein [Streptomyces sp. NBC_00576]WUB74812.1 amidase domain-containing protein [Streptomyces sp. NBC_00576]